MNTSLFTRAVALAAALALGAGGLGAVAAPASARVPAAAADADAQAVVTVVKDLGVDPTGRTVRVTGSGFDPAAVQGTVLLKGRPAGVFVLFGRMPDVWERSKGVPSSVRMAGRDASSQKWAVLAADMDAITDDSHEGATVLEPDGTFVTTIRVDRHFEGVPGSGNFGIYTYAGDILNEYAPYETYTPIAFVGDTGEVDLPTVGYPTEPTPVPPPVTEQATKLTMQVVRKATRKKPGRVRVVVRAGKVNAAGRVKVTIKVPGRKAVTRNVALKRGTVVVRLPRATKKGSYRVRATYDGTAKFRAAKKKVVKFKVTR